ncbi:MAG: UDP-glucose/GDP-mannose dehydrogenase family protein [Hyphomicrobiaceae bacterium]|nr:MAG: UDP-glucose/GDP-mannose dehydrogenase family protein [Hyphomicrobiaceae bacterium]
MSKPRVGYAGMTHLGLCSAIAAASKGFATLGFDADAALVARLEAGKLPVVEPDLDDLLRVNRARMAFSADPARLQDCDLVYVAPDVPTNNSGDSDLAGLDHLLELVLVNTRADAVVVLLSQVPPGYTRAHQRVGRLLYYQVETLVFGCAVERATKPERHIIGSPEPAQPLPTALDCFLSAFGCPILPMRFESAELTKISINCCLVASITVANTLAELCERIGADWAEIAPALRLDRRIGAYSYLAPGLGLAGGNLERDLATVLRISEEYGTDTSLIRAFVGNSAHRRNWPLRILHELVLSREPQARIGVLGLAYKQNTHSVKNSPSLALIHCLTPWTLQVFDPVVPVSATPHPNAKGAASALDAAKGVDALAIMTPWPQFRELACDDLARVMRGRLVLDPYRMLDAGKAKAAGLDYRTVGVA